MKTAEEFIKEHIPDYEEWADWRMEATVKAMQAYAKQCAQDALNRAAENAKGKNGRFIPVIDRESITSTEIITP